MGTRPGVGPGEEFRLVDTGKTVTVQIGGKLEQRPVFKMRSRLYCGELMSHLNVQGLGGTVWSAKTLERLEYNANFRGLGGNSH